MKVWVLLELPAVLARDLTIPNCDPATWNKYYAVAQPLCSALFALFISGFFMRNTPLDIPMFVIIIIATLPLCFLVYIFTYQNKPPQGFFFSNT